MARQTALLAAIVVCAAVPAACGGSATQVPAGPAVGSSDLNKLILRASQVGRGYRLVHPRNGRGTRARTLDVCGYFYPSEYYRRARLQVDYRRAGGGVIVSNEVVTYLPGTAGTALAELRKVVRHCSRGLMGNMAPGMDAVTWSLRWLSVRALRPGYVALLMHADTQIRGGMRSNTAAAIYQRNGDVLSAVYAVGGNLKQMLHVELRAARAVARNLR